MDGFIDWCMKTVDEKLAKSGMTQLQSIAAPLDTETRLQNFLAGRPRKDQYQETDPAKLQTQINGLSDVLAATVRQRDELQGKVLTAFTRMDSLTLKLWIVTSAVGALFAISLFLATQLFSRLH